MRFKLPYLLILGLILNLTMMRSSALAAQRVQADGPSTEQIYVACMDLGLTGCDDLIFGSYQQSFGFDD